LDATAGSQKGTEPMPLQVSEAHKINLTMNSMEIHMFNTRKMINAQGKTHSMFYKDGEKSVNERATQVEERQ
jgi:hypothetical protein